MADSGVAATDWPLFISLWKNILRIFMEAGLSDPMLISLKHFPLKNQMPAGSLKIVAGLVILNACVVIGWGIHVVDSRFVSQKLLGLYNEIGVHLYQVLGIIYIAYGCWAMARLYQSWRLSLLILVVSTVIFFGIGLGWRSAVGIIAFPLFVSIFAVFSLHAILHAIRLNFREIWADSSAKIGTLSVQYVMCAIALFALGATVGSAFFGKPYMWAFSLPFSALWAFMALIWFNFTRSLFGNTPPVTLETTLIGCAAVLLALGSLMSFLQLGWGLLFFRGQESLILVLLFPIFISYYIVYIGLLLLSGVVFATSIIVAWQTYFHRKSALIEKFRRTPT